MSNDFEGTPSEGRAEGAPATQWTVVLTPAGTYLGELQSLARGNAVSLKNVYEVVYEASGASLKRYLRPFLLCSHDLPLELVAVGLADLSQMHEDDRADWMRNGSGRAEQHGEDARAPSGPGAESVMKETSERKKLQRELAVHLRERDQAALRELRARIHSARIKRRQMNPDEILAIHQADAEQYLRDLLKHQREHGRTVRKVDRYDQSPEELRAALAAVPF